MRRVLRLWGFLNVERGVGATDATWLVLRPLSFVPCDLLGRGGARSSTEKVYPSIYRQELKVLDWKWWPGGGLNADKETRRWGDKERGEAMDN